VTFAFNVNSMLKRAVVIGAVGGFIAAVIVFSVCVWVSSLQAATEVSLSLAFRPWWRASNWVAGAVAFVIAAAILGARAACLSPLKEKK
jgi:hypothetical protein